MATYKSIAAVVTKFIPMHKLFGIGFNLSPMYRSTSGRVVEVSEDLMFVKVRLKLGLKSKNYVGTMFGGSMFSAVDPFPMVQLINILGDGFVVWDKSAEIRFKAPAKHDLYAEFTYSQSEIDQIKKTVTENGSMEFVKQTLLTDKEKSKVFCEVNKRLYVATTEHYRNRKKRS